MTVETSMKHNDLSDVMKRGGPLSEIAMNWRRVQGASRLHPGMAALPKTCHPKWMDGRVLALASSYNPAHSYISHFFKDTDWSGHTATSWNRFRAELRQFRLKGGAGLSTFQDRWCERNYWTLVRLKGVVSCRVQSEHWSGYHWCGVFHTNHGKGSVYRSIPVLELKEKLVSCGTETVSAMSLIRASRLLY